MASEADLRLPEETEPKLCWEKFCIGENLDDRRRYNFPLDRAFPLDVHLYEFPEPAGSVPLSWHERLEIFCPLDGPGLFRIGKELEVFEAGDILLVDNLKLHRLERFDSIRRRALVVLFNPELVAAPGALPCDVWLLRPFRHFVEDCLHLKAGVRECVQAWECLSRLVAVRAEGDAGPENQIRQKLIFLELLLLLEKCFAPRIQAESDYLARKERLRRLTPLFDYLASHCHERHSVASASRLLRMSPSYFMRFFRLATGMTLSAYLEQMRVSRALELLAESDLSLNQIAAEAGFFDQCHLSRHIRRRFGMSPGRLRTAHRAWVAAEADTRNRLDPPPPWVLCRESSAGVRIRLHERGEHGSSSEPELPDRAAWRVRSAPSSSAARCPPSL